MIYSFLLKRTLSFCVYCLYLPKEEYNVSGSEFLEEVSNDMVFIKKKKVSNKLMPPFESLFLAL